MILKPCTYKPAIQAVYRYGEELACGAIKKLPSGGWKCSNFAAKRSKTVDSEQAAIAYASRDFKNSKPKEKQLQVL